MQPLHHHELIHLVQIMREMKTVALTNDWQKLERLDNMRRDILIEDNDSSAMPTNRGDKISGKIQGNTETSKPFKGATKLGCKTERDSLISEISALDKEIILIVESARQNLLDKNRGFSAQVKAKELYAQTSTMT